MTRYPRTEHDGSVCGFNISPSLAELAEMQRERRSDATIMAILGLVCMLVMGFSCTSIYFGSAAPPDQGLGAKAQPIGESPQSPSSDGTGMSWKPGDGY